VEVPSQFNLHFPLKS